MPAKPTNDPSNYFGQAIQSAPNVEASANFFFFRHLEGSGFEVDADITSEREGGDGQEIGLRYKTKVTADGAVAVNDRPQAGGRLLAAVLGQDTVSDITPSTANIKLHTAAPAASLPYFTMEQRAPDDVLERSTNNVYTGLTVEWEAGQPLKLTGQFINGGSMARREAASALTVTRESAKPFQYPGASVSLTVNDDAGSPATTIKVTKGKIEIRRAVDDDIQTTGLNREDVVPLAFEVDLDATVRYEDANLYRRCYYGGGSQVQTELATGTFNLFTARGSFSQRINMPLLEVAGAKLNRLDPDGKTVYLDLALMSIKNATHAIFAETRTADATSYLVL